MDRLLVQASGVNSRPSWASRAKTGRNDTVMMRSEKKRAGPTSFDARVTMAHRSSAVSMPVSSRATVSGSTPCSRSFAPTARSRWTCMCGVH